MKKLYRHLIIATVLAIPVLLYFGPSLRSHPAENSPLLKVFVGKASGLKIKEMTDELKNLADGDERLFLLQSMFAPAPEYASFPLIQKQGEFLGVVPRAWQEIEPLADLAITEPGKKTFYKFQYLSGGVEVELVAIPEDKMTNMGQLPKDQWLTPNDIEYPGKRFPDRNFPYRFRFTAVGTPAGDINYWVFVSDENQDINKVMEAYQKNQEIPLAQWR